MIPTAVAQAMFLSALGDFRRNEGHEPRASYTRLIAQYGITELSQRQEARRIVDAAQRSNATARALEDGDTSVPVRARDHPIDPTCNAGYCYRVVIQATDNAGNKTETAVTMNSATPLSADQLTALARQQYADLNRPLESPGANDRRSTHTTVVDVFVVSAGRQR